MPHAFISIVRYEIIVDRYYVSRNSYSCIVTSDLDSFRLFKIYGLPHVYMEVTRPFRLKNSQVRGRDLWANEIIERVGVH
jgi:hypothetical protein